MHHWRQLGDRCIDDAPYAPPGHRITAPEGRRVVATGGASEGKTIPHSVRMGRLTRIEIAGFSLAGPKSGPGRHFGHGDSCKCASHSVDLMRMM